jgi:tetratricopeptide (TPR) repeat protein
MKLRIVILCSLLLTCLMAVAANKPVSPVQEHENAFNFDWNKYSTATDNRAMLAQAETFLKEHPDLFAGLPAADQAAMGKLLYKLGTYYTHISRQSDLAIADLERASPLLKDTKAQAWNYNHLAYAYEQKFADGGKIADKTAALGYTHKVIAELYPHTVNSEVAFAFCVEGLVYNDAKDFPQAERRYKQALAFYEKIPGGKDDQYARAKNRLANIILDENNHDQLALAMLLQVKHYWMLQGDLAKHPYAARNFITLGQAYLKTGATQSAQAEFNDAIAIMETVYGKDNKQLIKPYLLMAEAYKRIGNETGAALYKKKAEEIGKS